MSDSSRRLSWCQGLGEFCLNRNQNFKFFRCGTNVRRKITGLFLGRDCQLFDMTSRRLRSGETEASREAKIGCNHDLPPLEQCYFRWGAIGTETAISVCDQQQTWERGRVVGSVTCVPGTTRKKIPSSTTIAMTPKSPPSGVSTIQQPSGSSSPMVRVHLSINPPLLLLLCVAAGSLGLRTIGFPTCCKPSPLPVSRCLEVVPDVYWYASSSAAPQASKRNRFF